jgi:outer membrane protein
METAKKIICRLSVLLLVLHSSLAYSKTVELLSLPLSDGTSYVFNVNQTKNCSFAGVSDIKTTKLKLGSKSNALIENINLLQREMNLAIAEKDIRSERISFSIKGADNIKLEFSYDKNCELIKKVYYNNKVSIFEEINIAYNNTLYSPVLKKMTFIGSGNYLNIFLYPWALHGQIATYELAAGPALNIHSNIRRNSLLTFEGSDPVIEPIPAFFFRYGTIFLNKDGLGSLVFHHEDLNIVVMGLLEGEPYRASGLKERTKGFFMGSILKYQAFEFIFYKDFFKSKGTNLKINMAPEFYLKSDWKISPQVFLQYWDDKYVNYYFGVQPSESLSSALATYKGTHTINYGTMMEVIHYVDNWTFLGTAGVKHYGNEVSDSPTVTKNNEFRFITSVLYKFF